MSLDLSVFEMLARSRREWLAQGVLMAALSGEGSNRLRRYVLESVGRRELVERAQDVPEVHEERRTTAGWRADLELSWPNARHPVRLELKLGAGLSHAQREAHRQGLVDGWVVAKARLREFRRELGGRANLLTWEALADRVDAPILSQLLREAGASGSLARERVAFEEANSEFAEFSGRAPLRRWPALYGFLISVDTHLAQRWEACGYQRSPAPAQTPSLERDEPYYGFTFTLNGRGGIRPFWYGFARDDDGALRIYLEDRRTADGDVLASSAKWPMDAGGIARAFHRSVENSVARRPRTQRHRGAALSGKVRR